MSSPWRLAPMGALAAVLGLQACAPLALPTNQDDLVARAAIDDLRKGDFKDLASRSGPEIQTPVAKANLAPMQSFFPKGEPLSVKRTGWRAQSNVGQPAKLILDEAYEYPDRTVTAEVVMSSTGAAHQWRVDGMHVNFEMKAPPSASASPPASAAPPAQTST